MKDKINVGIAGIANHGVTIRNAALRSENINVVYAYDINNDELQKFAAEAKCKAAKDYDEIINDPEIDAVILVTPNHLHWEQVKKAVDKKKHIFLEKPITNFVSEGIELTNYAKKGGVILQIGHHMRYRVHYRETKKLIDEKKIGDVVSFYCNFSHAGGFNPNIPKWKMDKKTCPLLPMMQVGIHFIDSINYMVDDVVRVSCLADSFAMGNGILDSTVASMQLKNGVVGVLNCHYVIPPIFEYKIFGTKGTIHVYNSDIMVETYEGDEKKVEKKSIDEAKDSPYYFEVKDFAEKVLTNGYPEVDGLTGLKALAAIEAMNISVEQKRTVDLDEVFDPKKLI